MSTSITRAFAEKQLSRGQLGNVLRSIFGEFTDHPDQVTFACSRHLADGAEERRTGLSYDDLIDIRTLGGAQLWLHTDFRPEPKLPLHIELTSHERSDHSFKVQATGKADDVHRFFALIEEELELLPAGPSETETTPPPQDIVKVEASHHFEKGFLLDEERLNKIETMLSSRLDEVPSPPSILYKVERADGVSYETPGATRIIQEENYQWQRIEKVSMEAGSPYYPRDEVAVRIRFDKNGAYLHVGGEDQDTVHLMFRELQNYISNEVTVARGVPDTPAIFTVISVSLAVIPLVVILILALAGAFRQSPELPPDVSDVLRSTDLNEKLNYLIELQADDSSSSRMGWILIFTILWGILFGASFFLEGRLGRLLESLFPTNLFLFGKEIERYHKVAKRRENLAWGVGVGFVVSVIAGLVTWVFTK